MLVISVAARRSARLLSGAKSSRIFGVQMSKTFSLTQPIIFEIQCVITCVLNRILIDCLILNIVLQIIANTCFDEVVAVSILNILSFKC